jgi:hypothetical protein
MENSRDGIQQRWKTAMMENSRDGKQQRFKTAMLENSNDGMQQRWKTAEMVKLCEPYVDGASHERGALVGFLHDGEEVGRHPLLEVIRLHDAAGEVLHRLG